VFGPHERLVMLESALDAAIEAARADMGNVQLKREDGLHIVAQRGFNDAFLEFFDRVRDTAGGRIVVADVAADPIFAGTEAAKVMEAAGVRAVQSTPLIAASGVVLGMLSTHYCEPRTPDEDDLQEIDLIARRAAFWLEEATA
jgi:GAF domain-containing protein